MTAAPTIVPARLKYEATTAADTEARTLAATWVPDTSRRAPSTGGFGSGADRPASPVLADRSVVSDPASPMLADRSVVSDPASPVLAGSSWGVSGRRRS